MTGRVGPAASKEAQARRLAVIRALWFTECTVAAIGERLGLSGTRVSVLAKRAGLPPRHEYNRLTPKPPREPGPNPGRPRATAEQLAKKATDRRSSPPGQPEKAVIVLRLALRRDVLERMATRAIRESVRIEAVVEEILEGAAK